jgi:glycosyltransferase involved in cell wall biosynthesis
MGISIITPSYNQSRYIERTIQSVLAQGVADLEYFVIDGGSQDETLSILNRYSNQLKWCSEKDYGQADAVNKGLKLARGEIIGWLNSDDIYYPDTIKKIEQYFAIHPEVDVVYGDAYHIDQYDQIIEKYPTEEWSLDRFKKTCFISQPTVFWRRRVLEQYGYLNTSLHFCLDYEYWLRLALSGVRFGYLKTILAGSRLYPETKTKSAPLQAQLEALSMLRAQLGYVPREWLLTYAITVIKTKTSLRYPSVRFLFSAWMVAFYQALRFNGYWKGIKSLFSLPLTMIAMKNKHKKLQL